MSDRKPRLTEKVLRGLNAVRAAVEAGDLMEGDLAPEIKDVKAAFEWVERMLAYRNRRADDNS